MPTPYQLAQQFRAALLRRDADALREITAAYDRLVASLQLSVSALGVQARRARAAGQTVNAAWLFRERRLNLLLAQAEQQLALFTAQLNTRLTNDQQATVNVAQVHTQQILRAAGVEADLTYSRLPVSAIENLVGFSGDGAPLAKLLSKIPSDATARIRETLIAAIATGQHPRQTATQLKDALHGNLARAQTIARTETLRAYREASRQTAKAVGVERWQWISSKSQRTCLACLAMDGKEFSIEKPQPNHPNCLTAGTMVVSSTPMAGTSRRYEGEIVEITVESGHVLSVTPNHPILTTQGWLAAGLLEEGGNVISSQFPERLLSSINPNNDYIPTQVEQVWDSLSERFAMFRRTMPAAAEYFHGDGEGGQVEIVATDSQLRRHLNASFAKPFPQQDFIRRNVQLPLLSGSCPHHLLAFRNLSTPDSLMRLDDVSSVFFGRALGHHQPISFNASTPDNRFFSQDSFNDWTADIMGFSEANFGFAPQVSGNDFFFRDSRFMGLDKSSFAQDFVDNVPAHAELLNSLFNGSPGNVKVDRIIKINRRNYAGHVYNLQTETGWYIANNIMTHNCRCTVLYLPPGYTPPARELGAQWFEKQPDEVKQAMMSKVAFEAYQKGEVTLQDFVGIKRSRVWGETRYERSFKDALKAAQKQGTKTTVPTPKWKPSMSRRAAERWARDSVWQEDVFHVTDASNVAGLQAQGFDVTRRTFGRAWGNGIYVGTDEATRQMYEQWTRMLKGKPQALTLKINVKSVFRFDASRIIARQTYLAVAKTLPDGERDFRALVRQMEQNNARVLRDAEALPYAQREAFLAQNDYQLPVPQEALIRLLQQRGYDALHVTDHDPPTSFVGGNQIVVFKAQNVVIIR